MWKNTNKTYGLASILLHWLSAISVFALFIVGYWMVDLNYYSEWYRIAPYWHKSIGILLLFATLLRLSWRVFHVMPAALSSHSVWVKRGSHLVHLSLYCLLLVLFISGYLISTADNRALDVFNWFHIPALGELFNNQADIAGAVHKYIAYLLIALSLAHALAAIKHHVIDKDMTLSRMLRITKTPPMKP